MPAPEVVTHAHTWVELGLGIAGFGGIILTQWRTTLGTRNDMKIAKVEMEGQFRAVAIQLSAIESEAKRVADQATAANSRTRKLEVQCAANHGTTLEDES